MKKIYKKIDEIYNDKFNSIYISFLKNKELNNM